MSFRRSGKSTRRNSNPRRKRRAIQKVPSRLSEVDVVRTATTWGCVEKSPSACAREIEVFIEIGNGLINENDSRFELSERGSTLTDDDITHLIRLIREAGGGVYLGDEDHGNYSPRRSRVSRPMILCRTCQVYSLIRPLPQKPEVRSGMDPRSPEAPLAVSDVDIVPEVRSGMDP